MKNAGMLSEGVYVQKWLDSMDDEGGPSYKDVLQWSYPIGKWSFETPICDELVCFLLSVDVQLCRRHHLRVIEITLTTK
jgi:hypothetical protein